LFDRLFVVIEGKRSQGAAAILAAVEAAAAAETAAAVTTAEAATAAAATVEATARAATLAATVSTRTATAASCATRHGGLARQEAFALEFFASKLTSTADRLRFLAGSLLRRFFKVTAELHLAENALALQFFLKRLEGLVNVVVANENLQAVVSSE
jgi:hypothetical protein